MDKELNPQKIVLIGASTGGPVIIEEIVRKLPRHLKATIIIVQHLSSRFTVGFADRLRHMSQLSVHESGDGDILLTGSAILLKGDNNFYIKKETGADAEKFILKETRECEPECSECIKPHINTLMISAAECFGKNVIGVILSGMGDDGLEGARAVKEKGGIIIIEDEKSSAVYGMPGKIKEAKLCDFILTPEKIAEKIIELTS